MANLFKYQGKHGLAIMLSAARAIPAVEAWRIIDDVQAKISAIRKGVYSCTMSKVLYDELGLSSEYLIFFLD